MEARMIENLTMHTLLSKKKFKQFVKKMAVDALTECAEAEMEAEIDEMIYSTPTAESPKGIIRMEARPLHEIPKKRKSKSAIEAKEAEVKGGYFAVGDEKAVKYLRQLCKDIGAGLLEIKKSDETPKEQKDE
jgi:hypothetical protein